jgi:hypothetical protein
LIQVNYKSQKPAMSVIFKGRCVLKSQSCFQNISFLSISTWASNIQLAVGALMSFWNIWKLTILLVVELKSGMARESRKNVSTFCFAVRYL